MEVPMMTSGLSATRPATLDPSSKHNGLGTKEDACNGARQLLEMVAAVAYLNVVRHCLCHCATQWSELKHHMSWYAEARKQRVAFRTVGTGDEDR